MTGASLLDMCLGSLSQFGQYKYHSFSPCLYSSAFKNALLTASLCNSDVSCKANALTYARAKVDNNDYKTLKVVGIAKDGHRILGPYKSDGSLWQPCDVDICNGLTIEGSYYYVLTNFYPYTIGCWGPANSVASSFSLSCTNNPRVCGTRMLQ